MMKTLALLTLLVAMPGASAQRMSGRMQFGPRQGAYGGFAYPLFDPLFTDATYPVPSQPLVIVVPQSAPAVAQPVAAPAPAEPLLIELRGDQYVRVSGQDSSARDSLQMVANDAASSADAVRRVPASQPVATVLVFRDGHREEISEYTIAQGSLYASANYYASGSWLRKIDLSKLNLAETQAANRSRNVRFTLPASPNEVIVAP